MFSTKTERAVLLALIAAIPAAYKLGLLEMERWLVNSDSKILANGSYVMRDDLDEKYISKKIVDDNYVSRTELEKSYVARASYEKELKLNAELKEKADMIDSALDNVSYTLDVGKVWHPKNPEFLIRFTEFYMFDGSPRATIDTSFLDSQPHSYKVTRFNEAKLYKFSYMGYQYELKATLKMVKEDSVVEVFLKRVGSLKVSGA
ncbi:hypothetical protein [Pseudomonas orientalis]|jgi:desulfoferrodoxin (superoxide reductase-like protein)|uniref:hypothetical protein n=1 Tax=Pseudomonas orientalis TaxID=76758 RepID=UPI0030DC8760